MGIDPIKVAIIKCCLEVSFKDVMPDLLNERWVFNDGQKSRELILDRGFIDDFSNDLKTYMESTVIPMLQNNPDKIIRLSKNGITISNRSN